VVGTGGGTLAAGDAHLAVPSGAVVAPTAISIEPVAAPAGLAGPSQFYKFSPDGLTFAVPVKVTFAVPPGLAHPTIFWTRAGTNAFENVGGDVSVPGQISVFVTHFSQGGVAGDPCFGVVCGMPSDACHVAGVCDALTGACSNPLAADGTPCDDANACTQTDTCHGGTCLGANPVVCGPSAQCHTGAPAACDPATGICVDVLSLDGEPCEDGNACTLDDACRGGVCMGALPNTCSDGNVCTTDACDVDLGCTHLPAPSATVCRPAAGACDSAETCGGASWCPLVDAKLTGVCRNSAGACDMPETCDGIGNECPRDVFAAAGMICRPSTGACDPAEFCSGSDVTCPGDTVVPRPTAPTGLAVTGGDAHVSLGWAGVEGASGYKVKRGLTSGALAALASIPIAPPTYIDATAANGTAYYYTVSATANGASAGSCESADSIEVSATPSAPRHAQSVAAGAAHSCAIRADGSLWCWGYNHSGDLGDGTATSNPLPVQVAALGTGVVEVVAGADHTCARKVDGTLWCWGSNQSGQVGDGTSADRSIPTQIAALGTSVVGVSAGANFTCAWKTDRTLWCWGDNSTGQLGLGLPSDIQNRPMQVVALGPTVSSATAGGSHACATRTDGTLWCWGANGSAQVDPSMETRYAPAAVNLTGLGAVASASAGGDHTCALMSEGGVLCWGANGYGQAGNGGPAAQNMRTPMYIQGLDGPVRTVVAGDQRTCALRADSTLWCWGYTPIDQFRGDAVNFPVQVTALGSAVADVAVASAKSHVCARRSDDTIWCWGINWAGQLGDGSTTDSASPVQTAIPTGPAGGGGGTVGGSNPDAGTPPPPAGFATTATGLAHTCAIRTDGTLWCWGANNIGQVGDGTTTDKTSPVQVTGLADFSQVSAGDNHTCALRSDSTVSCWGSNVSRQLGLGITGAKLAPTPVTWLATPVIQISAGGMHTCAVTYDNALWCWGANNKGQIGDGTTQDRDLPVQVTALGRSVAQVATGAAFSCARKTDDTVWCWGYNADGQLGDGTRVDRPMPVQVAALGTNVASVAAGSHSCAVKTDGTVWCWGYNGRGELGDGTTTSASTPVQVNGLPKSVSVSVGRAFTCAWDFDHSLPWCWGYGANGRLGNGATSNSLTPVRVTHGAVSQIATGGNHACARELNTGVLSCWGSNSNGQLGNGTTTDSTVPTPVPN
jgi:alpha-tubulin suppressor-like RCC1 family protein